MAPQGILERKQTPNQTQNRSIAPYQKTQRASALARNGPQTSQTMTSHEQGPLLFDSIILILSGPP